MNYFDNNYTGQEPMAAPQMYAPQTMAGRMLQHPGMAAFNQGANNIAALKAGGVPNMGPGQAYQGQVNQLSGQQRMNQELQMLRAQALRRNQMAKMEMERLSNPAYEFERLRENGHLPEDMTYQEYLNSAANKRAASSRAFAPQMGKIGDKRVMVTPVYNPADGTMSYQQTALPEGFVEDSGIEQVKVGDRVDLYRKADGQFLGSQNVNLAPNQEPDYLSSAERAKVVGKSEGAKDSKADKDIRTGNKVTSLISMARDHPGRTAATGKSSVANPVALPGSDRKDFLVLHDQLTGNAFLQAYQELKGGGPITDREGEVATQAQNRLNLAQSEDEYLKALDEMDRDVQMLLREAEGRTGQSPPPSTDDGWSIERVD